METVSQNATEAFRRHKLRRASDFGARSRALAELGRRLGLRAAAAADRVLRHLEPGPDRHGGLDGGVRGRPAQAERLPAVRDQGSARTGRFRKHGGDAPPPAGAPGQGPGRPASAGRFAYPPALIVVDGGRGQLSSATKALADADVDIPAIGLAKRLEEVYFPGRPDPLVIPRGSEALFVLQHLRDEAHRFAITYHREKRGEARARLAARRRRRGRAVPEEGAAEAVRLRSPASRGRARTRSPPTPGVGPDLARAIHDRLTTSEPAGGGAARDRAARARRRRRRAEHTGERGAEQALGPQEAAGEATGRRPRHRSGGVHDHHRALRRRPFGGREVPRGSRLLRGGQPPARAAAEDGGAGGRARADRVAWPSCVDVRGGVFFGELSKALQELEELSVPYSDPVPRGVGRRPGEPVRGRRGAATRSPRRTGWSRASARSG